MELGETTEPELQGPEQGFWMRRLEAEHDNIRAALVWSLEREPVIALRLAQALYEFWWRNFQREGRDVLENALERATATPKEIRAKALRSLAQLTTDTETVKRLLSESRTLFEECDQPPGYAWTLHDLGNIALFEQHLDEAQSLYETSAMLFRREGNKSGLGWALRDLSRVHDQKGDLAQADQLSHESIGCFRETGNKTSIAICLGFMGKQAQQQEDLSKAREYFEESLALFREVDHRTGVLDSLKVLGPLAFQQGDVTRAQLFIQEAVSRVRATEDTRAMANALQELGESLVSTDPLQARDLLEECLTLRRLTGDKHGITSALFSLGEALYLEGDTAQARSLANELLPMIQSVEDKDTRWRTFMRLGTLETIIGNHATAHRLFDESLVIARQLRPWPNTLVSQFALTQVALIQDHHSEACSHYQEAARIYPQILGKVPDTPLLHVLLILQGSIHVAKGEYKQGAWLLGAAERHEEPVVEPLFRAFWQILRDRNVTALRQALGEEEFTAVWSNGNTMLKDEAISYVLESSTHFNDSS
jgi:tetratricopeptide (TPR) repeat protein